MWTFKKPGKDHRLAQSSVGISGCRVMTYMYCRSTWSEGRSQRKRDQSSGIEGFVNWTGGTGAVSSHQNCHTTYIYALTGVERAVPQKLRLIALQMAHFWCLSLSSGLFKATDLLSDVTLMSPQSLL